MVVVPKPNQKVSTGAEEMLKGRRLKQNLPYDVIHEQADSLDKGTCQNPEFALILVKNGASESCAKV